MRRYNAPHRAAVPKARRLPTVEGSFVFAKFLVPFVACFLSASVAAQSKIHIDKAADLPRFSYKLDSKIEDMIRDDAKFKPFAAEVRRDLESVLAKYEIDDRA